MPVETGTGPFAHNCELAARSVPFAGIRAGNLPRETPCINT